MRFRKQFWLSIAMAAGLLAAAYVLVVANEFSGTPEVPRDGPLIVAAGVLAFLGLLSFGVSMLRGFARVVFVRNGALTPYLFQWLDYPLWHWWLHIDATGRDRDA